MYDYYFLFIFCRKIRRKKTDCERRNYYIKIEKLLKFEAITPWQTDWPCVWRWNESGAQSAEHEWTAEEAKAGKKNKTKTEEEEWWGVRVKVRVVVSSKNAKKATEVREKGEGDGGRALPKGTMMIHYFSGFC